MTDGEVVIKVGMDTKRFDRQIQEVGTELNTLEQRQKEIQRMKPYKGQEEDLQQLGLEIEKVNNKLVSLNQQKAKIEGKGIGDINKGLDTTDKKLKGIITKVGKWGLAVFGVRSAYMLIRRTMSTLTQYNDQLATDLEYINYAIARALEPVIRIIVNLVYELLGLLNKVTKLLFNYDIFANAGADGFKKANKNAKQLQKTLTGFDEVNIVGQTGGGATGSTGKPSFNLTDEIGTEGLETVFDKIKEKFDKFFEKIKTNIKKSLKEAFGLDDETLKGLDNMLEGAKEIFDGLFDTIDGTMTLIIGVLSGDPEKVKKGWQEMIDGIGKIVNGFIDLSFGWKETLLSYVDGFLTDVEKKFGPIGSVIVAPVKGAIDLLKTIFTGLKTSVKNIVDGIIKIFKGDFSGIKNIVVGVINVVITALNTLISGVNAIASPIRLLIIGIGKVLGKKWTLDNIKIPSIKQVKAYTGAVLDSGRLVNLPGRGVPIGGALTGERGQEGVIPLTNQQAMEQLGQTIGKYITINASITNTMNGRVISKELKKINAENEFAFNR